MTGSAGRGEKAASAQSYPAGTALNRLNLL